MFLLTVSLSRLPPPPGGVPEGEGQDPRGGAQPPTHATHARPPKHGIGGPDMNRGRGVLNARLFAKWIDLEASLVGCFSPFRDTVLQK